MGGYKGLEDYGNTMFSQAKEKLIRGIAADVASAMKVNSKFAETAPIDSVIEKLSKIVPDPRKGKKFVKDAKSQEAVCRSLAKAINKRYGSNVINVDASAEEICRTVGELMYSLFTGLHTEFLVISSDVGKIVRNLKALREYIDASNRKLKDIVFEHGTESQKGRAESVHDIYEKLRDEVDRQLAILTNILNATISPLGSSLVSLLEKNHEFKGLILDLGSAKTGTAGFSQKLGYLLDGVSSVSHAANLINKALKTLGMTVADYKNAKGYEALRKKIYEHMAKKNPNSLELRKMLEAADIIYKTDYDHSNIVKYLESKSSKKGGGMLDDDSYDLEEATERELGLKRGYVSRKSMGLQMKEQKHHQNLLFDEFKKVIQSNYRQIIGAVSPISRMIGSEVPVSDELYKFVVRFGQLESPDRENLHLALSGYRQDVASKHVKNVFVSSLRAIHGTLEPLKSGAQGSRFRDIQNAVGQLIRDIDTFSDKFVKAITEIPVDISAKGGLSGEHISGSALGGEMMFSEANLGMGDGSFNALGGAYDTSSDPFVSMEKVQKELNYYFGIANLRSNLGRSSAELESYGQDYENILGDEIAALMDQVNKRFNEEIELADYESYRQLKLSSASREDSNKLNEFEQNESLGKLLYLAEKDSNAKLIDQATAREIAVTFKWVRTYQKNAKVNLLKAAESLDLYMKNFTSAIVAHPDDVRDLVGMMEQITIVAKWFTNRTGDHLAALFESWPADHQNKKPLWSNGGSEQPGDAIFQDITAGGKHYYEWVKTHKSTGLGNPNIPWYPLRGHREIRDIFRRIEKTFRGMRALENIISTFSKMGDKYGDKSIKNSTFMSHGKMYKVICDYLAASSVSMGATGQSLANADLVAVAQAMRELYTSGAVDANGEPLAAAEYESEESGSSWGWGSVISWVVFAILVGLLAFAFYVRVTTEKASRKDLQFPSNKTSIGIILLLIGLLVGGKYTGKLGGGSEVIAEELKDVVRQGNYGRALELVAKLAENKTGAPQVYYNKQQVFGRYADSDFARRIIRQCQCSEQRISQIDLAKIAAAAAEDANRGKREAVDTLANISSLLLQYAKSNVPSGKSGEAIGSVVKMLEKAIPSSGVRGGSLNDESGRVGYSTIDSGSYETESKVLDRIALTLRSASTIGYDNDFADTDHIFELMMKSMVCKVLTVIGVFTVFNRPGVVNRSITPLRMVLGAGKQGGGIFGGGNNLGSSPSPPVIDEAVELYIRLPLLAEWYREKFGFKRTDGQDNNFVVSMVPSFDGVWSDFVRIIFVEADFVKDGSYTDMTLKKLILAINEIYNKYKTKGGSTVRDVINAFVMEINRRYGFVKRNEINDYFEESRGHLANHEYDPYPDDDRVDYDILEDGPQAGNRPAPSDRFRKVPQSASRAHRFSEKEQLMIAVLKFRKRVEDEMMEFSANFNQNLQDRTLADNKYSFVENILQVVQKLKGSTSGESRFNIVRDAVQGVNKYSGISYEKTLLFNELVVTPLTILTAVHNTLEKFCCFAHGTNTWLLGKIASRLTSSDYSKVSLSNDQSDSYGFLSLVKREIKAKYPHISEERCNNFAAQMWHYANHSANFVDAEENGASDAIVRGDALKQKNWEPINQRAWRRFCINRKLLVKDLLNAIFSIGCDMNGLVDANMSSGGFPVIDYSRLQEVCVVLYNQVKSAIGEFRTVLSQDIINTYESSLTASEGKSAGSLLWVEENLIEIIFNNRDKAGLPEVNESLAASWGDLSRAWDFDASNVKNPTQGKPNRDSYNDAISELIYWNYKTDKFAESRDGEYTKFPALYIPIYKSGNFDAVTHDEKLAQQLLGRSQSTSPEVLGQERKYRINKFLEMVFFTGLGVTLRSLPNFLLGVGWEKLPTDIKNVFQDDTTKWFYDEIKNRMIHNTSVYYTMENFLRWFISKGSAVNVDVKMEDIGEGDEKKNIDINGRYGIGDNIKVILNSLGLDENTVMYRVLRQLPTVLEKNIDQKADQ